MASSWLFYLSYSFHGLTAGMHIYTWQHNVTFYVAHINLDAICCYTICDKEMRHVMSCTDTSCARCIYCGLAPWSFRGTYFYYLTYWLTESLSSAWFLHCKHCLKMLNSVCLIIAALLVTCSAYVIIYAGCFSHFLLPCKKQKRN